MCVCVYLAGRKGCWRDRNHKSIDGLKKRFTGQKFNGVCRMGSGRPAEWRRKKRTGIMNLGARGAPVQ